MASQPQQVNVSDLDVAQLSDVRKQLEEVCQITIRAITSHSSTDIYAPQEINHLTNSFAQLKQAQAKFKACVENVNEIKLENKGVFCPCFIKCRY
jgi:prefoldin alpha subunit